MKRILLLLEHRGNSRLLSAWLAGHYQVLSPNSVSTEEPHALEPPDEPFDLCILDGPALDHLWKWIQARRAAEQPVFLPFLLVTPHLEVRMVTRHLWQNVDELVTKPIEKLELRARVEILLRSRQLSVKLKTANEQLQYKIVERKRVEEALRRAHDQLEMRVQERTKALTTANEALQVEVSERQRAEKKLSLYTAQLEQSNRELKDFAQIASHDLQEPLRKIQFFSDRLKTEYKVLNDQERDLLERMQSSAGRVQTLINDLLSFFQVSTKAQPFLAVNLLEVAQAVVSDLQACIEQTGGRVEVENLPTIDADKRQMHQLLQHLIDNALKFHSSGKAPVVKVYGRILRHKPGLGPSNLEGTGVQPLYPLGRLSGLHPIDQEGSSAIFPLGTDSGKDPLSRELQKLELCQVVVKDNGIGFDEKYLDRIFTAFQRLHGHSNYEGTGIGLAVCRKIAERHGGEIRAKSTPGQGATFIITLPVKRVT